MWEATGYAGGKVKWVAGCKSLALGREVQAGDKLASVNK